MNNRAIRCPTADPGVESHKLEDVVMNDRRPEWEKELLALLVHLRFFSPLNPWEAGYAAYTRIPGNEQVTLQEFQRLAANGGRRGVGFDAYVIATAYPGGGFTGAEKVVCPTHHDPLYAIPEDAQAECEALNRQYGADRGRPYRVFRIQAFACQVQQVDAQETQDDGPEPVDRR